MNRAKQRILRFNRYSSIEELRIQAASQSNWELALRYREWLLAQDYSSSTRFFYDRVVRLFLSHLGTKSAAAATHFDVRTYLADQSVKWMHHQEIRRHLYALRAFYDFLLLGGVVDSCVPRFVVPRTRFPIRVPHVVPEDQMKRFLRAAPTVRDRAIVELVYATGCRLGELVQIRLQDVDLRRRSVRLNGKSGPRVVFFGRPAEAWLRRYLRLRGTAPGALFLVHPRHQQGTVYKRKGRWMGFWSDWSTGQRRRRAIALGPGTLRRHLAHEKFVAWMRKVNTESPWNGVGLREAGVQRVFEVISLRAGIGKVTCHMLRHSCATHMLLHGANLRHIQEMLGHAWIGTTQVYTYIEKDSVEASFRRFHPRR